MRKLNTCAILLAAGEGSRMGYQPKSLLQFKGESFLQGQVRSLQQVGIETIYVVTGFYHQQIEAALQHQPVHILRNPEPARGQQSSVSLALTAVDPACDLILMMLADQPLINASDLKELLEAFELREHGKEILYPVVEGQRGNPVLLSGRALSLFLGQTESQTCRQFIDGHAELVHRLASQNRHFIVDIDTPEDLKQLES